MRKIADKKIDINYSFSLFSLIRRGLGLIIIIVLATLLMRSYTANTELNNLTTVLSDSLVISKNKEGEMVAKMSAYQTQRTKDFIDFATKDSLTIELQKEVKDMKRYLRKNGSVTKFSTSTEVDTKVPTEVSNSTGEYPTYNSKFNLDNWVFGDISASKDSTRINLQVKNDYSVVVGREPTGFLGLGVGKPFVQVTNKNKYSSTKTLKTYNVSFPKPKRIGIGPHVGLDVTGKVTLGISVNYDLIQF